MNHELTKQPYEKVFFLGTGDCDFQGKWKLSSLLDAVQNTSNEQSDKLHIWHYDNSSRNLSWVLYKNEMELIRRPHLGESVKVITYTKGIRLLYCPRYCLITDEKNDIIAKLGFLLMLIDRKTRKAVSPTRYGIEIPDVLEIEPAIKISMKHKAVTGKSLLTKHIPQYEDVDINGHVNNSRYIDWLCNDLGFDYFKRFEIESISIDYESEILPEDKIETTLIFSKDRSNFQYTGCANGVPAFDIVGNARLKREYC